MTNLAHHPNHKDDRPIIASLPLTQEHKYRFKPSQMPRGSSALIVGAPRSGKTILIKDLIKRRNLRHGAVFSWNTAEWSLDQSVELLTVRSGSSANKQIQKRCMAKESVGENHFFVFDDRSEDIKEGLNDLMKFTSGKSCIDLLFASQDIIETKKSFDYIFFAKSRANTFSYTVAKTYRKVFGTTMADWCLKIAKEMWDSLAPYEFLVLNSLPFSGFTVYKVSTEELS